MPVETSIYVDVLFLINFLMDYLLLWAAARLAQVGFDWWRLVCGAILGACYSVLVLLPRFAFLSEAVVKFLLPALMLAVVFMPLDLRRFGRLLLDYYIIFINMVGAALLLFCLAGDGSLYDVFSSHPLSTLWLLVPLLDAVLLGMWGVPLLHKAFMRDLLQVPLLIRVQGEELRVEGMVDTGNQLFDPLTGAPVIIVEYGVLARLLPRELEPLVTSGCEPDLGQLAGLSGADGHPLPLRLIPFNTIGKQHGLLVGLKPERVTIISGDRQVRKNNVVIGLYNKRLSPQGRYRALLHPDLLRASVGM